MQRLVLSAFAVALPAFTIGVRGHTAPGSIQGGWRTVEVTVPGPNGRTIANTQPNLIILTAKHYSRVEIHTETPRPILADVGKATADDLRAAWGPFVAEAGTYEVTGGDLITMRPIVAKNPAAMVRGAYRTYTYKLAGDTLLITARGSETGPVEQLKIKAVRVE